MKVYELVQRLQEFDQQLEVQVQASPTMDYTFEIVDIEEDEGFVIIEAE